MKNELLSFFDADDAYEVFVRRRFARIFYDSFRRWLRRLIMIIPTVGVFTKRLLLFKPVVDKGLLVWIPTTEKKFVIGKDTNNGEEICYW